MKKLIVFLIYIFSIGSVYSQSTDFINYQAIVRDGDGDIVGNASINIRITLLSGSDTGTPVYTETHDILTDDNGYFNIKIGGGVSSDDYTLIDWGSDLHYAKNEYDFNDGEGYQLSSTSQLTSVPYALHAKTVDNITETDPVFEASVSKGITEADTTAWNDKLDNYVETDPIFNVSLSKGITTSDTTSWNNKLDSFDEVDPIFTTSIANNITTTDIGNWNIDNDVQNELQTIALTDNEISLSNGGGAIQLPQSTAINGNDLLVTNDQTSFLGVSWIHSESPDFKFNRTDWYYIAYTKSSSLESTLFINGVPIYTNIFNDKGFNHNQVHIGASFFTFFEEFLDGIVDEFRISNNVRTDEEIMSYYLSDIEFVADANTIGLWHFNEGTGSNIANELGGNGTLIGNPSWVAGKFGNAIQYDGIDDRGQTDFNPPEYDVTYEFWIKFPNGIDRRMCMIQSYGSFNGLFTVNPSFVDNQLIIKSPNGSCWRVTVDDAGQMQTTSITCPIN